MSNTKTAQIKLLVVNTSQGWGGLELNVIKTCLELQKRGIEIHMISQKDSKFAIETEKTFDNQILLTKCRKYFDFRNAKKIANYAKKHSIYLVFTAFRPDLDLLLWTKWRYSRLKIIHQQQMQIGLQKKGFFQRMRFGAVDLWLTPLRWLKDELLEKTTIEQKKIRIVPLGVDPNRFAIPFIPPPIVARKNLGIPIDYSPFSTLMGVIGRIDEKKGQLFVAKMVKKLLEEKYNVYLLIVGEPTINDPESKIYYKQLTDFIAVNKLEDRIFIVPFIQKTELFYGAIDLFVMASQCETYGMVTIEALLTQTPVIGTLSGGTPELLNHGLYGKLYEVDNEESFKNAFKEYLKTKSELFPSHSTPLSIKENIISKYSIKKEINGIIEALKELSE